MSVVFVRNVYRDVFIESGSTYTRSDTLSHNNIERPARQALRSTAPASEGVDLKAPTY